MSKNQGSSSYGWPYHHHMMILLPKGAAGLINSHWYVKTNHTLSWKLSYMLGWGERTYQSINQPSKRSLFGDFACLLLYFQRETYPLSVSNKTRVMNRCAHISPPWMISPLGWTVNCSQWLAPTPPPSKPCQLRGPGCLDKWWSLSLAEL